MKAILMTAVRGTAFSLTLATLSVAGHAQIPSGASAPAAAPAMATMAIQIDFANPGLSPSQWTLTVRPDGSGHFRSPAGTPQEGDGETIGTPAIDRDVQVSAAYAGQLFDAAKKHHWFNETCESHLKVAFEGWKTLTYTGPRGQGNCTFNYSKDKEIEAMGQSLVAVATTIVEGARLQLLLQHDRLGLDAEMEFLDEAYNEGRAQQIGAIKGILEQLVNDNAVLERVRKRARDLLTHAT